MGLLPGRQVEKGKVHEKEEKGEGFVWKRKRRMRETAPVTEVKKKPARQQEKSRDLKCVTPSP